MEDPKEPSRVIAFLETARRGIFVDYGCGRGDLLVEAANRGWSVLGIEFDKGRALATAEQTGLSVLPRDDDSIGEGFADVVHLGDVIEHLVDINAEMMRILAIIKPGGILVAQGPLEANPNLFTLILKLKKFLSRQSKTEMPPYHVLLATADGQRALFRRFGLKEVLFLLREVSWPAPAGFRLRHLQHPRLMALFVLRKLSQGVSWLRSERLGNRFFYVGQCSGSKPSVKPGRI